MLKGQSGTESGVFWLDGHIMPAPANCKSPEMGAHRPRMRRVLLGTPLLNCACSCPSAGPVSVVLVKQCFSIFLSIFNLPHSQSAADSVRLAAGSTVPSHCCPQAISVDSVSFSLWSLLAIGFTRSDIYQSSGLPVSPQGVLDEQMMASICVRSRWAGGEGSLTEC